MPGGPPKYRERMRPETKEWLETIVRSVFDRKRERKDFLIRGGQLLPFFTGFCTRAWGPNGLRDSMHINLVGVAPRAEKTGVGRALMLAAHEWADAHGVETTLWTQTENTVSLLG